VKLLVEVLISIFLHPIAFVLVIVNLAGREDLTAAQKIIWGIVSFVWGIGPILYILVGGGVLWGSRRPRYYRGTGYA
jgi:hypothetical protein